MTATDIINQLQTLSPGEVAKVRDWLIGHEEERGGQTYFVIPDAAPEKPITGLPDFKKRRLMFNGVLPVSTVQQLDKAITGD